MTVLHHAAASAALVLAVVTHATAQVTSGTILGAVTDPSGGVLPGVSVAATNLDTGLVHSVTTDAAGAYALANVPIGRYQLRVEMPGFKTKLVGPLTLIVDQRLRYDVVLELGNIAETMEIRGRATLLQTDQPDMNQIVQSQEIKALPLNGRDFFSLLLLSNGVQDTSNDTGGATTNVTFSINGMRPESNSVTLDGVQMASVRESDVDLRPSVDAIEEFKVLSSSFSAEYGHTAGGVISIQSKSGTNEFHGSGWEFFRDDALNASNFFRNPVSPTKPSLTQNQFGATVGGPLKKGRTFFFADYQGHRLRKINEAFARVPEEPFRRGDFSSLLPGAVVYDPLTGNPFPNNIIPPQRFSEFGSAILNAIALPNLPNDYPLGNYFIRQPHQIDGHEGGIRVDHVFTPNQRLFGRYRWGYSSTDTADALARPDGPMPGAGGGLGIDSRGIVQGGIHDDRNHNAVGSYVQVFGPRIVNDARVGFHRYELDVIGNAHGRNLAEQHGLHGVNDDVLYSDLPALYLNAYTNIGGTDFKPLYFRETFWQFNDTLTVAMGHHTLKAGGEYRQRLENHYFVLFPAGAFYFFPQRTTNYTYVGSHELAEVLLGLPMLSWRGRRFGPPDLMDRQYSFFVQEDWKPIDRLTVNLGVRYEYYTPFFSPTNEISMFDPDAGRIVVAGSDGVSRYIVNPDKNDFGARLGVAFMVNPKTTIRAGYGRYFNPENAFRDDIKFNPPFYRQYELFDQWMFDELPPPFPDPGPVPAGYELKGVNKGLDRGETDHFNVAIQREIPGGFLAEAAYVGSRGQKMPFIVNANDPGGGQPKPFPTLGPVKEVRDLGSSNYHSGQFKLEKRFSQGLFALASYTWSKSIDTMVSNLDRHALAQSVFLDPKSNRAISDWDVPHRFSLSAIAEVPYGKGRRYGSSAPAVAQALLGNWQITGIFIARSGMPGTVVLTTNPVPGIGNARPNLVGNPVLPADQRSPDRWFNTDAFERNVVDGQTLPGNAGRNIIRGPGYVNLDLGFAKYVPMTSGLRTQFRVEVFNVFNHPHFALPVLVMDDPAFGKITHTRNPTNFGSTATAFASRMIQLGLKLEF
jgi:Carboxypeptidase regulatory-like domain/TonB-dependent Receptor Plug Domain/TonB dependent receptor-like, beta-barrel